MHKLSLLLLVCMLWACSDAKDKDPSAPDASESPHGGAQEAGGAQTGEEPAETQGVERAPGALERPPGTRLPADLKPPGYKSRS